MADESICHGINEREALMAPFNMQVVGKTDVGNKRQNNEDNFAVAGSLLVVADGMGGAAAGEVASSAAVEIVTRELADFPFTSDTKTADTMSDAVILADTTIKEKAIADSTLKGMGTTVVVVKHFDDRLLVANVGDSRAYIIADSAANAMSVDDSAPADMGAATMIIAPVDVNNERAIKRITDDNSVVMQLVKSGVITEEDIRTHPLRNRITKSVGSLNDDTVDTSWYDIENGDVLLMCSDGLWEMVHEDIIQAIVGSSTDLDEMCDRLIGAANDGGGHDNITVIVARFTSA
jgi:PPM family protein phosphatase